MVSTLKKINDAIFCLLAKIQKTIVFISLIIIYFLLFGILCLIVAIFHRELLWPKQKRKDSFWREPLGYEPDIGELLRQS